MVERRRFRHTVSLQDRLAAEAAHCLAEAEKLPPGAERDELMRRARQAETGSHMNDWLSSPGLRPPAPFTDADNAKRFRDKAAEALQLIDLAETESRRSALRHMADHYNRAAEQLEGIAQAHGEARAQATPSKNS